MEYLTDVKIPSKLEFEAGQLGQFIGNTPLWELVGIHPNPAVKIYAKLEWQQLGQSVKSRAAYRIIFDAIRSNLLTPGVGLLDATSGNTGIAYATICARLGIECTLLMPANATESRKQILRSLGAKLILTDPDRGTDGSRMEARQLAEEYPYRYYYANQYGNESNWLAHYHGTGSEIWARLKGRITHFTTGVGTSGSFMGTARRLKKHDPSIKCVALQPDCKENTMEGWKHMDTAIVPEIYDPAYPDSIIRVNTKNAMDLLLKIASTQGLMVSPSAAANLAGAIELANQIDRGVIVTIFPDDASKYKEIWDGIMLI